MMTPQDKIIIDLKAEIHNLNEKLYDCIRKRENLQKQFDELKVILRET